MTQLRLGRWQLSPAAGLGIVLVGVLSQTVYAAEIGRSPWWGSSERVLGERLRERYGTGEVYVSGKGKVAWHADGVHLPLPSDNPLEDIATYMKNRNSQLMIVDHARFERHPEREWLQRLWRGLSETQQFREVDREREPEKDLRVFRRED